jgi:tetratricopeptide (TPR) repeat protein
METQTEPNGSGASDSTWRPAQAYLMAVVCFVIGCAIGYLLRGSAPPKPAAAVVAAPVANAAPSSAPDASAAAPSLEDMKRMGDKQAQPLLTELQAKPNDAALLNKTALTYKAAHQFEKAAEYFKKSLDTDPKNIAVRADYASCLYYLGDVDGALAQLNKSLTYDPKHPGTLFNIGVIELNGKHDADAAVAAWQKLLNLNPDLPQKNKDQVLHMIEAAKQSKATVAEKN